MRIINLSGKARSAGLILGLAALAWPQPPAGYQMTWSDEFTGASLDGAKWEALSGTRRDAIMDPADAYLEAGNLVIRTRKVGDTYHNGFIRTRGRYEPTYGYFEARIKTPKQVGHWSAFWLHGREVCENCPGVEVDIMEYPFRGNTIVQNLHWNGYATGHKSVGSGDVTVSGSMDDYHTYAVEWTPQAYVFFIDGKESWRSSAKVSQVSGYVKLTDEVGDWAGNIAQAALPDYMRVEYVRVYQKPAVTLAPSGRAFPRGSAPVLALDAWGRLRIFDPARMPGRSFDLGGKRIH